MQTVERTYANQLQKSKNAKQQLNFDSKNAKWEGVRQNSASVDAIFEQRVDDITSAVLKN